MRRRALAGCIALAACGGGELDQPRSAPASDTHASDQVACAPGQRTSTGDICFRTGIQRCAPEFEGADGLCRPSRSLCPGGTVADTALGCLPVGIDGCDARFVGDDGLCRPASATCAPGSIPAFESGCTPTGIVGCAAPFVGTDGVCHVDAASCPAGTVPLPNEGCVAIGADCADPAPASGDVYVSASQTGPGDGSLASPFPKIAAALAVVADGGRIVIDAGDYDESITIDRPITAVGRCASDVRLHPSSTVAAVVSVTGAGALHLSGVTLSGPAMGVLVDGGTLDAHDVAIVGATGRGVHVTGTGAHAALDHVAITDTLPDSGGLGQGLRVSAGARADVESCAFVRNRALGVQVDGAGTSIAMRRSSIVRTAPVALGSDGRGLVIDGATATLEGVAVASSTTCGIALQGGAALEATSVVVDGTLPTTKGTLGFGVCVAKAATATMKASVVTGCRNGGVYAEGAGVSVALSYVLVDATTPDKAGYGGVGLWGTKGATITSDHGLYRGNATGIVADGATLSSTADLIEASGGMPTGYDGHGIVLDDDATGSISRTAVTGTKGAGIVVENGAAAGIDRCLVTDTSTRPLDGLLGFGVHLFAAGSVRIQSTAVLAASVSGIAVQETSSETVLEHVLVAGTTGGPDGKDGQGVRAYDAPTRLLGCTLVGNRTAGLFAGGAGRVILRDSVVEDTLSDVATADYGAGVYAVAGPVVLVDGCAVSGNHVANVLAFNAEVQISESLVSGAQPGSFTDSFDQRQQGIGDGVVAVRSATCNLFTVRVELSARAGILFDDADGRIEGTDSVQNALGVVRQGALRPDIGDDVSFGGNTKQDVVSSGDLPVPNKALPLPKP